MKTLLHIRVFNRQDQYHIWLRDQYAVHDFIEDIQLSWNLPKTAFPHFFYHLETDRILDNEQTFDANGVVSGDHCVLF